MYGITRTDERGREIIKKIGNGIMYIQNQNWYSGEGIGTKQRRQKWHRTVQKNEKNEKIVMKMQILKPLFYLNSKVD